MKFIELTNRDFLDTDGIPPASDGRAYAGNFSVQRTHRIIHGVGLNVPQEIPQAFAHAFIEVDGCAGDHGGRCDAPSLQFTFS